MTTTLTPALALDYIRALSADVRVAVVLDRDGEVLAGPADLQGPARAFLAGAGRRGASGDGPGTLSGRTSAGAAFAARDDHHAILVITGPHALTRLTLHDLRTALSALGGETLPETRSERVPETVTSALLSVISAP